ncbi:hypothetical protein HMPREF1977_2333, partial [Capnocytophaga ochracea F0287]
YQEIKQALLTAPALGLPDLTKPFELFVDEKQGYAKGVLTQKLGPWRRPVAYLSKKARPSSSWVAPLPTDGSSHCRTDKGCRQANHGTATSHSGPPCSRGTSQTTLKQNFCHHGQHGTGEAAPVLLTAGQHRRHILCNTIKGLRGCTFYLRHTVRGALFPLTPAGLQ